MWGVRPVFAPALPLLSESHELNVRTYVHLGGVPGVWFFSLDANNRVAVLGALLPAIFWVAQGASFAFPGAEGFESMFPEKVPRVKGVWVNERFSSALVLALIALGYAAERRRRTSD
jgi:hypothetical protein